MKNAKDQPSLLEIPQEVEYFKNLWNNLHKTPPPTGLFHYTDAPGLHGIIKSGEFWATHVYYLNDSQEFRYAGKLINEQFGDAISGGEGGDKVAFLDRLRKTIQDNFTIWSSMAGIYSVCFCADGNLLSQWRAYSANGSGFSLGFDPSRLMERLKLDSELKSTAKLLKVIYERSEQIKLIRLAIEQLLVASGNHTQERVLSVAPLLFSEMALCFKHEAFIEEDEWRLVVVPRPFGDQRIDVRVDRGGLLPYTKIPFCDSNEPPPYVEVTHGPTIDPQNTQKAIKVLLGKANPKYWDQVRVTGSDAPFRPR